MSNFSKKIKTDQQMNQVFNLTFVPSPTSDPEDLVPVKFNYEVNSIENSDTIHIKVTFENPEVVSMQDGFDKLKLAINRTEFKKAFIILGDSKRIVELPREEKFNLTMNIPLQMPK